MVIQSNMSPKAIVETWGNTVEVFKRYNVPLSEKALETIVDNDVQTIILKELNSIVGSSSSTCIEGG